MSAGAQARVLLIARTLLALLFLVAGLRGFMAAGGTAGYFASLGMPMPQVMAWLAIVVEIGGAAALIVGWQTRRAAWLLIVFVAIATATAHRFWELDGARYANELHHFLKNLAIIGGLLYIAALGPGALSVDARPKTG